MTDGPFTLPPSVGDESTVMSGFVARRVTVMDGPACAARLPWPCTMSIVDAPSKSSAANRTRRIIYASRQSSGNVSRTRRHCIHEDHEEEPVLRLGVAG